jgi:signal transduction histidine kinase
VTSDRPRRDFQALAESPVKHVVDPCRSLLLENETAMNTTAQESESLSRKLRLLMLILGLGGPIGGLLSGYGIARALSRSIYRLSVRVHDMAQHLEHDVASIKVMPEGDLHRLDGQLLHIVRRVEEVTERVQRQQRELLRAEQLAVVGKLAACVAHEIRNPLSAVKMLVSLALRPSNPKPLTAQDLRVIHEEIVRLERTVQNLLDFSRPPPLHRVRCDLREVIGQAMELVRARAEQQGVTLSTRTPERPVEIEADRNQLCTVLVNLFFNALDAMPRGGRLDVDLPLPATAEIQLQVADTGSGISAERMVDLFTPFASSKATGTGLGLSICRRIVEAHGGCLSASNRSPAGASFRVSLPATAASSSRTFDEGISHRS